MAYSVCAQYGANVAILLLISRLEAWSHAGMCFVLAAVCLVTLLCTYAFVPDTKGVSLEQMDALFDDVSASTAVGCPGLAGGAEGESAVSRRGGSGLDSGSGSSSRRQEPIVKYQQLGSDNGSINC